MSTALQTTPHHYSSLASPVVPASGSGHQYISAHSSPSREIYHANRPATSPASPSSSNPAARGRSGNNGHGASNVASPPSQSQPPFDPSMTSVSDYHPQATDRRRNMPPIAPPRTSSTNQNSTSGLADSTRRAAAPNDHSTASPRRHPDDPRAAPNGHHDGMTGDEHRASSSRRKHTQMAQEPPERISSSRDARAGGSAAASSRTAQPAPVERPDVHDDYDEAAPPPVVAMGDHADQSRRGGRSRHDQSRSGKRDKSTKFGDYILGNVIGEGEFGKVRLGWKQDDKFQSSSPSTKSSLIASSQVAIKIIKKESLGNNPSRLAKIHREVNILKGLSHPNIVHLHDMIGDESRIGIVLEYASGGELFDYILKHRYLKDQAARRLFAQLISGVGYLHKKGIVHRDLKLENLLLDRSRNIIITDFGFANIFDPKDELSEEEELNLSDREFVKRIGLDKVKSNGTRRGDLMQTSCGSPCYAAPELVVSDSLYTGRKVDVWSCGVILYAMLAGYLPFDDDPANPEGDNINLLYKYIVNTPLTFPEYVSPHARDLLRRILVPNPRRRADLFEVARHSWLSEYASVVGIITSSTTTPSEIQNTTVPAEDEADEPGIARSASVREASAKPKAATATSTVGGLAQKHGHIDAEEAALARAQKDAKRRTVQVEYVAPTTQTQRGEYVVAGKSRTQGQADAAQLGASPPRDKPLPRDPPVAKDPYGKTSSRQAGSSRQQQQQQPTPTRPARDADDGYLSATRPQTGGSMQSGASLGFTATGRGGSYGQPAPPAVAGTSVHGRIQQPSAVDGHDEQSIGRPSVPAKFARVSGFTEGPGGGNTGPPPAAAKGHKRSSTIGSIGSKLMGRSGSIFGRSRKQSEAAAPMEKSNSSQGNVVNNNNSNGRKYPPVSLANSGIMGSGGEDAQGRPSMDSRKSRRSFSLGLGKKRSGSVGGSQDSVAAAAEQKQSRRFSLLPSLTRAIGLGPDRSSQQSLPLHGTMPQQQQPNTPIYDQMLSARRANDQRQQQQQMGSRGNPYQDGSGGQQQQGRATHGNAPSAIPPYMQQHSVLNTGSDSTIDVPRQLHHQHQQQQLHQGGSGARLAPLSGYQQHHNHQDVGYGSPRGSGPLQGNGNGSGVGSGGGKAVLQKNKRFVDAYDDYKGHDASSGAAKKVMDFFRRRGKARAGDER